MNVALTTLEQELFTRWCTEAPHWNGQPLLDIDKRQAGVLTSLKKKGLVYTELDDISYEVPCYFVCFTDLGKELAKSMGYEIEEC